LHHKNIGKVEYTPHKRRLVFAISPCDFNIQSLRRLYCCIASHAQHQERFTSFPIVRLLKKFSLGTLPPLSALADLFFFWAADKDAAN
jgi:hypothetical protein